MTSLALVMLLTTAAADAPKPVVSVLYFENSTGDASLDVLRKGLADMIITDLVAWDGVAVVERMKLEAVLAELKLQQTKAIDRSTAVRVGKVIGAQYAITGSMNLSKNQLRIDATVTSIEKGTTVASASVTDDKDRIFELEQALVDKLTAAIDVKLRGSDARKKAKVPSLEALLAYSQAIDLSDHGKIDEAQKAMAAVVSKSPTFVMARERKQTLLKSLEEFNARKKDLVSGAVLEVNKRADSELSKAKGFEKMGVDEKKAFIVWRTVKSRFLARLLKQSLSLHGGNTRVVRVGAEAKAVELMRAWAANQRQLALELKQLDPMNNSIDLGRLGLAELLRDSGLLDGSVNTRPDLAAIEVTDFVIGGRLSDGDWFHVAPQLGVLDPLEQEKALKQLQDAISDAEAAWSKASPELRLRLEYDVSRACMDYGEKLEWLRRDDDAAAAYQKVLDLLPTSDAAKRAEQQIQEIIGAKHEFAHSEREKFEKSMRTCDGLHAIHNEVSYRVRRKGLPGLDEIEAEVEKNCGLRLGTSFEIGNFYRTLATTAADHEDCVRAKRFYLKSYAYGSEGPRGFAPYFKNEPWCSYGLEESMFPSKLRVNAVGSVAKALEDILGEELGARGIATERGGNHGGVASLNVSFADANTLKGKLNTDGPDLEVTGVVTRGVIDLDAFFAPLMKQLQPGNETGGRKPGSKLSMEVAAEYGAALALYESRKYEDALVAFDTLAKKQPTFRLASMRAAMAKSKLLDNKK